MEREGSYVFKNRIGSGGYVPLVQSGCELPGTGPSYGLLFTDCQSETASSSYAERGVWKTIFTYRLN